MSYSYAFASDIGGGPYRGTEASAAFELEVLDDNQERRAVPVHDFERLGDALEQRPRPGRADPHAGPVGQIDSPLRVIRLAESRRYAADEVPVMLRAGETLILEAEAGATPWLNGDLVVKVDAPAAETTLIVDGIMLNGQLRVSGRVSLVVRDCTLHAGPERAAVDVQDAAGSRLLFIASILGGLALSESAATLDIYHSIVDGGTLGTAIADAPVTGMTCSTILGAVAVARFGRVDNTLFDGPVAARDTSTGTLTHCYVRPGTAVPKQSSCVPAVLLSDEPGNDNDAVRARLRPTFQSRRLGHPGYAQLDARTPAEISHGGTEGCEIGVFHDLKNPHRLRTLRKIIAEQHPVGWQPRMFFVT